MSETQVSPSCKKKRFNPKVEVYSPFHRPFSTDAGKVIDINVEKAAACCACTACTACR